MSTEQGIAGGTGAGEFMLFGVRVVVDSMRKSVSLNNLSQYEHRLDSSSSNNINSDKDVGAGYASADEAVPNSSSAAVAASNGGRERKRGVPWTEEEHKLFLIGLQKVGKGDWRGIARNFVKTRTPTQVASHAQKYFLRRSNLNRRRRRSSLFDITTETVAADPTNDQQIVKDNNGVSSRSPPPMAASMQTNSEISNISFSVPETSRVSTTPIYPTMMNNTVAVENEMKIFQPASLFRGALPTSSKSMADFDLNESSLENSSSPLSLNLSLSVSSSDLASSPSSASTRHSGFQFRTNGDSMISVA
uniref:Uncharacterized protein n=1 Tax=Opuntia streptacantha TaxID=393608 RepID=A0A7C9E4V0_OPUST